MTTKRINENRLNSIIRNVIREAIDPDGVSGDYLNDMSHLSDITGEEMDDAFLDSVGTYDNRYGDGGPTYPDRKREEMDDSWYDYDEVTKDLQSKYGKNAEELDKLNAWSDTVDDYVDDTNLNGYEDNSGFMSMRDFNNADNERNGQLESVVRRMVKKAVNEAFSSSLSDYDNSEVRNQNNSNYFAGNLMTAAHNYTHNGIDSKVARDDQDNMERKEKRKMKRNTKSSMKSADTRPLHRKGSLNRAFDESVMRNVVRKMVRESLLDIDGIKSTPIDQADKDEPYDDDEWFWKQQQEDDINYEMGEFAKAMQKSNGTYQATSRDGQWKTGDKVIAHTRSGKTIQGTIEDFDTNFMTYEEECSIDYVDNGVKKTLLGVPLDKIERLTTESKTRRNVNEEWYPEEDATGMDDYYYGVMMTFDVDGLFELSDEQVEKAKNIKDEYVYFSNNQHTSIMVTEVILTPDEFGGYELKVKAAISAPDMPLSAIEEEAESGIWFFVEDKLDVRSTNVSIVEEETVFDNRTNYKENNN